MAGLSKSFTNPRVNKLNSFSESVFGEENVATYKGVAGKLIYFVLIFAAGIGAFFYMHNFFAQQGYTALGGYLFAPEMSILTGASILTLITAVVSAFAPGTTPVTGTIYCAGMGYLVTFVSMGYAMQYKGIIIEALALTLLIIGVLAGLYSTGKIHVTSRFRSVVLTTLIVSILGSVAFALLYFLAPNSAVCRSIITINNGPIGILFAVIGVLIASAIIICDFDSVQQTVQRGLPKKYEWYASFSLVTSVIYLYLKVLQLLGRLQNNKS